MTTRTHTVTKKNPKNNQEWSWEETPEVLAAVEQLHKSSEVVKSIKVPTLHSTTQNYAQLKKNKQILSSSIKFKFEGQESSEKDYQESKKASRVVH